MIKKLFYAFCVSITSSCVILGSPNTQPSQSPNNSDTSKDGLLVYINFNGKVEDSSGNKKQVTVNNNELNFTKDRNNKDNSAFKFNGNSYLQVEENINPNVYNKLTMTAWVKPEKFENSRIYTVISGDDGGFDRTIVLDYRGETKGYSVFAGDQDVFGVQNVELNKWTFLAVVYDQENKTVDLFVNDKKYSKANATLGESKHNFVRIGNNPSYGENFYGDIDEIRIYGRKLSDKEINDIYKSN